MKSVSASFCNKNAEVEFIPELVDTLSIMNAIKSAGYMPIQLLALEKDSVAD